MFRRIFFHAVTAGLLASLAISGYCILFCMLAAALNYGCFKLFKKRGEIIFNFILSIVSFAMVMIPISISLPLEIKSPELFPGLGVPIIFFPALAWYTVNPIFSRVQISN